MLSIHVKWMLYIFKCSSSKKYELFLLFPTMICPTHTREEGGVGAVLTI